MDPDFRVNLARVNDAPSFLEPRALGRTSVLITPLALGTAPLATVFWGNEPDRAVATVEAAVHAGIGYFDTAPLYGLGEAETRLGAGLAGAGALDDVSIATKVGRTIVERDVEFDFSADAVRRQLEASLARLGRDRVDVVHVHDPEDHLDAAIDEAAAALTQLRDEGVIGAVSVGTNVVETARTFVERADVDAVMVAGRLSLLDPSGIALADECGSRQVAYLAAGVFNSGVLARPVEGSWFDYAPAPDDVLDQVRRLDRVCREAGVSLRAAAMQHPLRHPGVTAVIVGMASPDEVTANVTDLSAPIGDDVWQAIDEVIEQRR